jgi:hypothetical protein
VARLRAPPGEDRHGQFADSSGVRDPSVGALGACRMIGSGHERQGVKRRASLHHGAMRNWPREIFVDLDLVVRLRYCQSEPPPPLEYAVMLEVFVDGSWATIALWDNADASDEHHEHEYTRKDGKQPAKTLAFNATNDAMAAAIRKATTQWQAILKTWSES